MQGEVLEGANKQDAGEQESEAGQGDDSAGVLLGRDHWPPEEDRFEERKEN